MNEAERTKKFIQQYNKLDAFLRSHIPKSQHVEHGLLLQDAAQKFSVVQRHLSDLRTFSQLRNILVHDMYRFKNEVIAIPTLEIVERYEQIVKAVLNPPTAMSIAVPASALFTVKSEDNALKAMAIMNKKTFTHVPVLRGSHMEGVFSENTVFSYLVREKESIIDESMKIGDFEGFLGLDQHPSEKFAFVARDATIEQVQTVFSEAMKTHTRIGMIFITANGLQKEKLLGIITAWDLATV
jgi:predicted transcriptional regulator